jgi:hypothetical protein
MHLTFGREDQASLPCCADEDVAGVAATDEPVPPHAVLPRRAHPGVDVQHLSPATTGQTEISLSVMNHERRRCMHMQWVRAVNLIYQIGYWSTWTCILETTQMRLFLIMPCVAPKPSPSSPDIQTWFSAVSWRRLSTVSRVAVLSGPTS